MLGFRNPSTTAGLSLVLGIVLGGAGTYLWGDSSEDRRAAGQNGAPVTKTRVSALGRIEPSGGVISVFGLPGDRIEKLLVKQGDEVAKDTILAELASRKDRELERDLVASQLREARAQRDAIDAAGKAKIAVIDAEIAQLQSGRDGDMKAQDARIEALTLQRQVAQDNWNRLKGLKRTPVSAQDLEKSELVHRQAESELTAARAIRDKTEKGYDQSDALLKAKRIAAVAELEELLRRVPLDSVEGNLRIAERRLQATQVKAPVAGQILKVIAHEGDATANQPIFQLADTSAMVVIAEVYETDIRELDAWLRESPGVANITSRALDKPLTGKVHGNKIARMIAKNHLFSMNPREDIDRRVVEVRVDIEPDSVELASRYVGLEVEVQFRPATPGADAAGSPPVAQALGSPNKP
jgi:HlyD family secretion protein